MMSENYNPETGPQPFVESKKIKDIPNIPEYMSPELLEQWLEIPRYEEDDPNNPEWEPTPLLIRDLSSYNLGVIKIKDESVNPTGTHKDRPAWEAVTLYRNFARILYLKLKAGSLSKDELRHIPVPRLSIFTSGNQGTALAVALEEYRLPPPKFLVSSTLGENIKQRLLQQQAEIYEVDTSVPLSGADIRKLTENDGVDLTSSRLIQPERVFYDWHVHEVINTNPNFVYMPAGSHLLFENYMYWQASITQGRADRRYTGGLAILSAMNIRGAVASDSNVADKLNALHKPFLTLDNAEINSVKRLQMTGEYSGLVDISDTEIMEAFHLFAELGVDAEQSAAAGLALYIRDFRNNLILPNQEIVVVNTGKGKLGL